MATAPIITDLLDLFTETVLVEPLASTDDKGTRTYGTGVSFQARIVQDHVIVKDSNGQDRSSNTQVWLYHATDTAGVTDRFTLPGLPPNPDAINVMSFPDDNGDHHQKAFF